MASRRWSLPFPAVLREIQAFPAFSREKKIVFARQPARPRESLYLLSPIFHFPISPSRLIAVNRGESRLIALKK
jgi:hypothetical protein